eukprot:214336_1
MEFNIKELDKVDDRIKDLVFGYVRKAELIWIKNNIIPDLVRYICLWYYYIPAYFECLGPKISYRKDSEKMEIFKNPIGATVSSSYAAPIIPSFNNPTIYEWKIKVVKMRPYSISIGIDDAKCLSLDGPFTGRNKTTSNYGLIGATGELQCLVGDRINGYAKRVITDGTIVTMILNLNAKTLQYMINGVDCGIAYKDIRCKPELEYRMAVRMFSNTSVRLVSFTMCSATSTN